jgi:multiple sugar transport system substrate-binding protein
MNREQDDLVKSALLEQLRSGRITRRQFLMQMAAAGLAIGGISALGAPGIVSAAPPRQGRKLTPTYYTWITDIHPLIRTDSENFPGGVDLQVAPTEGFDVARFVAEARNQMSTWDVYIGMTPFVEMAGLVKAGVIEPWDPYLPQGMLDDMIPSIRDECTVDGKLYSIPLLIDVVIEAYNKALTDKANIADKAPTEWDEYLADAKQVMDAGAARYGCTFDAHGWRSLAPITHSVSTQCYYNLEGDTSGVPLYDFTSEPALQALDIMKKMLDLSSSNALQPGTTDGGVNLTPDEVAFGAQAVAYYIKYQNAPLRFARKWDDPSQLRLAALPKPKDGEGATVFWTTGACLFKYGQNKEKAAEYMKFLWDDEAVWKDSISGIPSGQQPGQLPPYQSIYAKWDKEKPDWLEKETWVPLVLEQLKVAKAIPNHAFGLQQFVIGQPFWEKYLKGEEADPKAAMQAAKDAVAAEIKKTA